MTALNYALDQVGVLAFACYGAFHALQARMNVVGVFVCAGLVAVGGGTVREVILHGTPAYLLDYSYVLVVVLAAGASVVMYRVFHRVNRYLVVLDAIGLGAFALFGAMRAAEAGFGLGAMMLCGVLTAVGGGVICDLFVGRPPQVLHGDTAIVPAVLTVCLARLLRDHLAEPVVVIALVSFAVAVRLIILRQGWKLWTPGGRVRPPTVRGRVPREAIPVPSRID